MDGLGQYLSQRVTWLREKAMFTQVGVACVKARGDASHLLILCSTGRELCLSFHTYSYPYIGLRLSQILWCLKFEESKCQIGLEVSCPVILMVNSGGT